MKKLFLKPFEPKYIIRCDFSSVETDFSCALVYKIKNGKLEFIDKNISKNTVEVKKFIESHEPDFFTFKYQFAITNGKTF